MVCRGQGGKWIGGESKVKRLKETVALFKGEGEALDLAISALEKQLNGGWTNAIEKPSKSDDYLVYYHKKYDSCNFETNWYGICSFTDIYGGWQTEEGETILAWQSLPEPYKEA